MKRNRRRVGLEALAGLPLVRLGAVVLVAACADSVAVQPVRVPHSVQVSPAQLSLDDGADLQVVATVYDKDGTPIDARPEGVTVGWRSSADSIATISALGLLHGAHPGQAVINAWAKRGADSVGIAVPVTVLQVPSTFIITAGNGQAGTVGQRLAQDLQARVTDRWGTGVPGITVGFTITAGHGTLTAPSAVTDASGQARVGLTLDTLAGANAADAATARIPATVLHFSATGAVGTAAAISKTGGDAQTAIVGAALASPLGIKVTDRYGNPTSGVPVSWQITAGGGSVTPGGAASNAGGLASATWTLGAVVGSQTLQASVSGVPVAVFGATALQPPVASVSVTPATISVQSGLTQQFVAVTRDAGAVVLTGRVVTWSSSDPTIASVDVTGLATAAKVGTATITVTSEGKSATATIAVTPSPVTSVVTVSNATLAFGETATLTLQTKDAAGTAATSGGQAVAFVTSGGGSTGTIGTVTDEADGSYTAIFTATGAGTAVTIGATLNGVAVTSSLPAITVTSGAPTQLVFVAQPASRTVGQALPSVTVQAEDASGNPVTSAAGAVVLSFGNNPSGATLGGTLSRPFVSGIATFDDLVVPAAGNGYVLLASAAGITPAGSATFDMAPTPAGIISAGASTVTNGDATTLTPVFGAGLIGSIDQGIGTVTSGVAVPTGALTASTTYTLTITNALGASVTTSASVTVVAAPSITAFTAGAPSVTAGTATNLTATFADGAATIDHGVGPVVSGTPVSTGNLSVTTTFTLTVTNAAGTTVTASVPVAVIAAPSITSFLTSNATPLLTIASGSTASFTPVFAGGTGSIDHGFGAVVSGTPVVTGSLTSTTTYTLTVTNALGATATGSVVITVTAPVATVSVAPPTASVVTGNTVPLSATTKDAGNNVLTGRVVTWSSDNTGVATVDGNGLVTAVATGSATITATSEGITGSASITVTAPPSVNVPGTLTASNNHTCDIRTSLAVNCWGFGGTGMLGDNDATTHHATLPVSVITATSFVRVAAGFQHTCGLAVDGSAWCWGYGFFGQMGNGGTSDALTPTAVSGGTAFDQIVSGNDLSCGRTGAGAVWCWGNDFHGARLAPVQLSLPALTTMSVTSTGSCGLSTTGQGLCWGNDFYGQAGDGPTSSYSWVDPSAGDVVVGGHTFVAITTGLNHACGVDNAGAAWCWGDNTDKQLGNSSSAFRNPTPLAVSGIHVFTQIFGGWNHTCALESNGSAWCWGAGTVGQLGNANNITTPSPQPVQGGHTFVTLALGNQYTCGRTTTGEVYCWGLNNLGQLGLGNPAAWDTPQLVH